MKKALYSDYFCGSRASEYAKKYGYLDYETFSKAFDAVLANNIISDTYDIGYWEQENGIIDNSDEIDELTEKREKKQAHADELAEMLDEIIDRLDEFADTTSPKYKALERDLTGTEKAIEEIEKEIASLDDEISDLEQEDGTSLECFQFFIVSDQGAELIKEYTNDPLWYNDKLDLWVWGITHYGISWRYVLTDIRLNAGEEAF